MGIKFVKLDHAMQDSDNAGVWKKAAPFHVNPAHVTTVAQIDRAADDSAVSYVNVLGTPGYYVWGDAQDIVNKLA